jgi:biopolymer transport protein ExbD
MKQIKLIIGVLLVLVMLGSVVSPVLAASTEQKVPTCSSCSKATVNKQKITVIEVTGIEKNEILAKALKNEDVKKLVNILKKKGYKLEMLNIRVIKVISNKGTATVVSFPLAGKLGKASMIYAITPEGTSVGAMEIVKKDKVKQVTLYYVDVDGRIKSYTVQGSSECWNCIWTCTGQCIIDQCAPYTPGICSFCYPLLTCCLDLPIPDNPCCVGALTCYGAIATGCFCWCTYHCNQIGECP